MNEHSLRRRRSSAILGAAARHLVLSSPPPTLPPQQMNHDARRFDELGFCVFPALFSAAEVTEMQQEYAQATAQGGGYRDPEYPLAEAHTRDQFWLDVCRRPKLLDAVERLIGPDILLVYSSFFTKPASGRISPDSDELAIVAFHQDAVYWPSVHGTDGLVTVWLAIDDADASNGTMQLIPQTHRPYTELEVEQAPNASVLSRAVAITPAQETAAVSGVDTFCLLETIARAVLVTDYLLRTASMARRCRWCCALAAPRFTTAT